MLLAKKTGEDFPIIPAGTHIARCSWVVDIGTQKTTWKGAEKWAHKVLLGFELPDELMKDGRPFFISNRYTLSLSSKAILRKTLEAWRGAAFTEQELEGFDLFKLAGLPCMLTVIHKTEDDKTYANIATISKLPKNTVCGPAVNPPATFSLAQFNPDQLKALPEWVQKTILQSREYQDMGKPVSENENPADGLDDDIPF
jgi:hypothetical protein